MMWKVKTIVLAAIVWTSIACRTIEAKEQVLDNFENQQLSGWQWSEGSSGATNCTALTFEGNRSLCINKTSSKIEITRPITGGEDKYFTVMFYDDMQNNETYFKAANSNNGQYIMVGVRTDAPEETNPATYFVSYQPTVGQKLFFDSGVKRTQKWHKFSLVVTEEGSYVKIDDFNTSYLGVLNGKYRAVNIGLKNVDSIQIGSVSQMANVINYDQLIVGEIEPYNGVGPTAIRRIKDFVNKYKDELVDGDGVSVSQLTSNSEDQLARTAANYALSLTLLCKVESDLNYCQKALVLANKIRTSYNESNNMWKAVGSTSRSFIYNPSPLTLYPLLISVAANKNLIEPKDWESFKMMFTSEANLFLDNDLTVKLPSKPGDSSSETLAWTGAFMTLMGHYFDNNKYLAMGEKLISSSLLPSNVGPGNKLYNHNVFHPGYAFYTIASVAEAGLSYVFKGQSIPNWHVGIEDVYAASMADYVDTKNGFFYKNFINGVDDWHRTPVDCGISAYSLLDRLGFEDKNLLGKYIWYVASDYQVLPVVDNVDVTYQVDGYQVSSNPVLNVNQLIKKPLFGMLLNSTIALYDVVAYSYINKDALGIYLPTTVAEQPTNTPIPNLTTAPNCGGVMEECCTSEPKCGEELECSGSNRCLKVAPPPVT
ncbi:MAG: hypothetical protein WCT01_05185, partial [Candidatus Shapirobacteria bacterium]